MNGPKGGMQSASSIPTCPEREIVLRDALIFVMPLWQMKHRPWRSTRQRSEESVVRRQGLHDETDGSHGFRGNAGGFPGDGLWQWRVRALTILNGTASGGTLFRNRHTPLDTRRVSMESRLLG